MAKVSIIIPVYNAEKYLRECLDSLTGQTLKDIEIICVDDGSTDSSLSILEEYKSRDGRIKVLHQQNQYAGAARNNGIPEAAGEYLLFLDADDFFDLTLCEKVYRQGVRYKADVVFFGAMRYEAKTHTNMIIKGYFRRALLPQNRQVFSPLDPDVDVMNMVTAVPWTKAFRREFILKENIRFQTLHNSNDVFFVVTAISAARRITYVDEDLTYYRRGHGMNLQQLKDEMPVCFIEAYTAVYEELKRRGLYERLEQSFINLFIRSAAYHLDTSSLWETRKVISRQLDQVFKGEIAVYEKPEDFIYNKADYSTVTGCIEAMKWEERKNKAVSERTAISSRETKERTISTEEQGSRTVSLPRSLRSLSTISTDEQGSRAGSREADDKDESVTVSVILPVFFGGEPLRQCLRSLRMQNQKGIEILCIPANPWLPAGTLEEIRRECKKESKKAVRLLMDENGMPCIGRSAARNMGLKKAKGRYVYFINEDGTLSPEGLSSLLREAEEKNPDVICFDGASECEDEKLKKKKRYNDYYLTRLGNYENITDGREMFSKMVQEEEFRTDISLYFFNRQYLEEKGFAFDDKVFTEEGFFTFEALTEAERVLYLGETWYKRIVRPWPEECGVPEFETAYGVFRTYCKMEDVFRSETEKQAGIPAEPSVQNTGIDTHMMQTRLLGTGMEQILEDARTAFSDLKRAQKIVCETLPTEEKTRFNTLIRSYDDVFTKYRDINSMMPELLYLRKRSEKLNRTVFYKVYSKAKSLRNKGKDPGKDAGQEQ